MNIVAESLFGKEQNTWLLHQQTVPLQIQLNDPYTDYIYEEMRQCYIHCLDHGAIVASCVALESVIKSTSYLKWFVENGSREHNGELWNTIDNKKFYDSIEYALKIDLISTRLAERLHAFRDQVRNKYLHGETPKEIKEAIWQDIGILNVKTGEIKVEDVKLKDAIHLQQLARIKNDRELTPLVVKFVYEVITVIYEKLEEVRRKFTGNAMNTASHE